MWKSLFPLAVLALVTGCGPSIAETVRISAPPRAPDCQLDFLQLRMEEYMMPNMPAMAPALSALMPTPSTYELVGIISLAETGVQNPFEQRYKDLVRPRACNMGGEGVTISNQATSQTALGGSGTSITYAVVRKRVAPGATPAPTKF